MSYIVGTDIGGTFTDFVLYCRETEEVRFWKELTTPVDPIEAVMTGFKEVDDLDQVEKIRLGTTIATNALLTRRGATWLTSRPGVSVISRSSSEVTGAVITISVGSRRSPLSKGAIVMRSMSGFPPVER